MQLAKKYLSQSKYQKYLVRSDALAWNATEVSLDALFLLSRRYLEIHNQNYQRDILPNCFKQQFSILIGQRGVGKTTFLIQYLLAQVAGDILSSKILYVPSDHFLLGKSSLLQQSLRNLVVKSLCLMKFINIKTGRKS